ncbi:MAG: FAD-dependent monooxygenase, partial [Micromonosporaceae bacterium]|nr:FAD-dependent monooxygenase [Micromonosporaceae bacterium]
AVLEDVLRDAVRQRPAVRLYEGWTFEGLEQDADGVTALLKDHGGRPARLRAAYLVGCDGAASAVRSAAGIATTLRGPVTQHCDVYLRSADPALRRYGRFFLAILASGLTLVSRDEHDTWTATFPLPEDWPSGADPVAEVRRRLGVPIDIEEVINVAYWQGRLGVADRYRDGRVFLAGDSAHQFFPTGGHGANTGIADAVDLGWKLAGRLAGWAGPALLASYALERRPVALFNREMCANLLDVWRRFPALAGDGATDAQLAGFLEQDAYQIDNLGIHCGYRYDGSPVIWPEQGRPPAWRWREIVPATWPGARVPSLRLANGAGLHGRLGQGFTMVDFSTEKRGGAAVELASARGIPMDHLVLDDSLARRIWQRDLVLVRPDQHVAWRGDAASDWGAILDRVTGWAEGR